MTLDSPEAYIPLTMSALDIRFHRGGVHLPHLGLWLDPREPQPGADRVFISHAHSDHIGAHREVMLTAPTAQLMQARISGERVEHILAYGKRTAFTHGATEYHVTLVPAGHIFGSAMSFIEADGASLLYTGDFKLRPGLSAEPCEPRPADILIMETTYGRPEYRFPPSADVLLAVIRFCREALDNDETPVLLGYSLGKSQELLCGLADAGLPIALHGQVFKLTEVYKQFGQCFPPYQKYESESARGKVLLCPPNVANSAMLRSLGRTRTAILTGWAVDPNCRYRYQTQAAFALSDHADFPELVELVKRVQPKKVYTLHGFAADFAQTLRDMGYNAEALSEDEQLALPLAGEPPRRARRAAQYPSEPAHQTRASEIRERSPGEFAPNDAFHAFAVTCSQIGRTSKKLEKVSRLADYLRTLDASALAAVNTWFAGHPFAPSENKVLQLGWAVIRDALCTVGELDHAEFGQVYLKHSDLGETAHEILLKRSPSRPILSVRSVRTLFDQLHSARGPLSKLPWLTRVLRDCTALEGKYLIKILTGDLRIGLKEGLLEEAIAKAFEAPLEDVKRANLLLGNIGETAQLAQRGALNSASLIPFRPIKYMLASPEETAADIWKRVLDWHQDAAHVESHAENSARPTEAGGATHPSDGAGESGPIVWIEDKYDGVRCQLHKVGLRAALYSRDLKEISHAFQEIADLARSAPMDFVLDGEIVAMRADQILPFAELQRRLGRREDDLFLREEIPVQFIAFDLLWFNGETYLDQPLQRRRGLLDWLPGFRRSHVTQARSAEEIERAFVAARDRGNEGLMIKDPLSEYTPGRRGLAWLKLKRAYGTLDCVVVGAEFGHGKRKEALSDYTFAVRDEVTGELKTIGKAYTGLTDAEIAELTQHFLRKAKRQHGRYFEVEPDTVLEIAFDAVQESDRHASGLALRFPRILRIRRDKAPSDINTVGDARKLLRN